MIFKPGYLLVGLSIFLILAIVCTIVVAVSTPQKEHQVTEPVIMAIVEDSRMLQSLPQPASEPPIQTKPMPAKVSIPTDESIDEAIFVVSRTANANYENFANPLETSTNSLSTLTNKMNAQDYINMALNWEDSKATKSKGKDIGGKDIFCYNLGESPKFCAAKCHANSSCRGYNYVQAGLSNYWKKGGCCYKSWKINDNSTLKNNSSVNFYTVKPSKALGASAAQRGAQEDKDLFEKNAAAAKVAIEAKLKAEAEAKKAEELKKKKEDEERIAKTIKGYRNYEEKEKVKTSKKYAQQKLYDPKYLIDSSKFLYATGGANDANGPDLCSAKCNADPTCRAFHYLTRPYDVHFKGTGGCQFFGHSGIGTYTPGMTAPIKDVGLTRDTSADSYVIIPDANGTLAQKGFFRDILKVQEKINTSYTHPGYTKSPGMDHRGDDIGKIIGGSLDQCRIKCDADPSCQAFNYVRNTAPGNPLGTCFYKRKALPIDVNNGYFDFFTKKPKSPETNAGTVVKK